MAPFLKHIMVLSLSTHSMEEVRHLFFKMNSQHASAFLKFQEDEIPSSHFIFTPQA
jgi:hypothetical protein